MWLDLQIINLLIAFNYNYLLIETHPLTQIVPKIPYILCCYSIYIDLLKVKLLKKGTFVEIAQQSKSSDDETIVKKRLLNSF